MENEENESQFCFASGPTTPTPTIYANVVSPKVTNQNDGTRPTKLPNSPRGQIFEDDLLECVPYVPNRGGDAVLVSEARVGFCGVHSDLPPLGPRRPLASGYPHNPNHAPRLELLL